MQRLVDTAARQPLEAMASMFNTNLVVADEAGGPGVLLRFRSRDGIVPRPAEGAGREDLLRPADAGVPSSSFR